MLDGTNSRRGAFSPAFWIAACGARERHRLQSVLPCRGKQQEHCGRVQQQRHDKNEPAQRYLVGLADQCCQIPHRTEIGLNHAALALDSGFLDLEVSEGLRFNCELFGKAVALGLPSFVVRGAEFGGRGEGCRLGIDGCGGPWRAGARRLRRSSYMRPISSSVTDRPL